MGDSVRPSMYVHILYMRFEETILAILYTDLSITITIAGKWLGSLISHDDKKRLQLMDRHLYILVLII